MFVYVSEAFSNIDLRTVCVHHSVRFGFITFKG